MRCNFRDPSSFRRCPHDLPDHLGGDTTAEERVFKTADFGATWTPLEQGAGSDVIINRPSRIVYDPAKSTLIKQLTEREDFRLQATPLIEKRRGMRFNAARRRMETVRSAASRCGPYRAG